MKIMENIKSKAISTALVLFSQGQSVTQQLAAIPSNQHQQLALRNSEDPEQYSEILGTPPVSSTPVKRKHSTSSEDSEDPSPAPTRQIKARRRTKSVSDLCRRICLHTPVTPAFSNDSMTSTSSEEQDPKTIEPPVTTIEDHVNECIQTLAKTNTDINNRLIEAINQLADRETYTTALEKQLEDNNIKVNTVSQVASHAVHTVTEALDNEHKLVAHLTRQIESLLPQLKERTQELSATNLNANQMKNRYESTIKSQDKNMEISKRTVARMQTRIHSFQLQVKRLEVEKIGAKTTIPMDTDDLFVTPPENRELITLRFKLREMELQHQQSYKELSDTHDATLDEKKNLQEVINQLNADIKEIKGGDCQNAACNQVKTDYRIIHQRQAARLNKQIKNKSSAKPITITINDVSSATNDPDTPLTIPDNIDIEIIKEKTTTKPAELTSKNRHSLHQQWQKQCKKQHIIAIHGKGRFLQNPRQLETEIDLIVRSHCKCEINVTPKNGPKQKIKECSCEIPKYHFQRITTPKDHLNIITLHIGKHIGCLRDIDQLLTNESANGTLHTNIAEKNWETRNNLPTRSTGTPTRTIPRPFKAFIKGYPMNRPMPTAEIEKLLPTTEIRRITRGTIIVEMPDTAINRSTVRRHSKPSLNGQICKLEPERDFSLVIQCHKCQQFGHHAKDCKFETVCLYCSKNHLTTHHQGTKDEPWCPNCCRRGHSGKSMKCQVFRDLYYATTQNDDNKIMTSQKTKPAKKPATDPWTEHCKSCNTRHHRHSSCHTTENENSKSLERKYADVTDPTPKELKSKEDAYHNGYKAGLDGKRDTTLAPRERMNPGERLRCNEYLKGLKQGIIKHKEIRDKTKQYIVNNLRQHNKVRNPQ